ncbi:MAG: extracellular solute-binding protein [Spirochaetes bacterium]|nr:extracellular solute-binding protein [Spirochaetota bacterium]
MKQFLIRILSLLVTVTMLSAAVDESAIKEDEVELRLKSIPSVFTSDPTWIARRKIFEAFIKRYPKYKVRAVVPLAVEAPGSEGTDFFAVIGGVAPDVFWLLTRHVADYRDQKFLIPLNDYLKQYQKEYNQPYRGIYAPSKLWKFCQDASNIYVVPTLYYNMMLGCHNPTFANAGLGGRLPKDWDELYEFARKMTYDPTKEGGKPDDPFTYGFYIDLSRRTSSGWQFLQWVWSAGGDVVLPHFEKDGKLIEVPDPPVNFRDFNIEVSDEAENHAEMEANRKKLTALGFPINYTVNDAKWRLVTDRPKAIRALNFYRKLLQQPWIRNKGHEFDITAEMIRAKKAVDPVTGDTFDLTDKAVQKRIYKGVVDAGLSSEIKQKFIGIRIITMQEGGMGNINEDPTEYTYTLLPPITKEEQTAVFIMGHFAGVNAAIAEEDKPGRRSKKAIQDAAWKYIEFSTGPEAEHIRMSVYYELGLAELVRPTLLKSAGYADVLSRIPEERLAMWDRIDRYGKGEPRCKGFTQVMTKDLRIPIDIMINDPIDMVTGQYAQDPTNVMRGIVERVNTTVLGEMPKEEIKKRSMIGWVLFVILLSGIVVAGFFIVKFAMRAEAKFKNNEGFGVGGHPGRRRIYAYLFLIPALFTIAVWAYYPLVRGTAMAFQDYKLLGGSTYVGLKNFIEVVSQGSFWRYFLQTFLYVGYSVGIGFLVPIVLAIMLTEIPKGKIIYRTVYYLPAVTTGIVTLFLWKGLLYDTSKQGIINQMILWFNTWPVPAAIAVKFIVLAAFVLIAIVCFMQVSKKENERGEKLFAGAIGGIVSALILLAIVPEFMKDGLFAFTRVFLGGFDFKEQKFLQDPNMAMLWVVIPSIWAHAGPGCLIYLAALKGIPDAQYEAADIDGAGVWKKVVHIMIPNLKALILINFVGAVVGAFHASQNVFVMTGGGPEDKTMTVGLYIWFNAFMFLEFGVSTAAAWIIGAMLIGFTFNQLRIMNKLQFRSVSVEKESSGGGSSGGK